MTIYYLPKNELFSKAAKRLINAEVILDIGCGIKPQRLICPRVHICCEPFEQYLDCLSEAVKREFDRSYVLVKASWSDAVRIFPDKSVDTVFLLDVIEHLEKSEALELLMKTERIARRQIVIFTPLGFMPQRHLDGKDAWGLEGGLWQEHKSGWLPRDFGDSWEIFAAKDFHSPDSLHKKLDKPYGAIFAIKNMNSSDCAKKDILETASSRLLAADKQISALKLRAQTAQEALSAKQNEMAEIFNSRGWKILNFFKTLKRSLPFGNKL
jgi:hypothetical protein